MASPGGLNTVNPYEECQSHRINRNQNGLDSACPISGGSQNDRRAHGSTGGMRSGENDKDHFCVTLFSALPTFTQFWQGTGFSVMFSSLTFWKLHASGWHWASRELWNLPPLRWESGRENQLQTQESSSPRYWMRSWQRDPRTENGLAGDVAPGRSTRDSKVAERLWWRFWTHNGRVGGAAKSDGWRKSFVTTPGIRFVPIQFPRAAITQ